MRDTRAAILLVLLSRACPLRGKPKVDWYVPGAVARLGPQGIADAWPEGHEPPHPRNLRDHLYTLQRAGCLVMSPGDWESRADGRRHPDTIHLLFREQEAAYWLGPGRELLQAHPEAKTDPDLWRRLFARWRSGEQLQLAYERPTPEALRTGLRELACSAEPTDLLSGLAGLGIDIRGAARVQLGFDRTRFRGAIALLWQALERGDRVQQPAAWLVKAWRADALELAGALDAADRREP